MYNYKTSRTSSMYEYLLDKNECVKFKTKPEILMYKHRIKKIWWKTSRGRSVLITSLVHFPHGINCKIIYQRRQHWRQFHPRDSSLFKSKQSCTVLSNNLIAPE